MVFNDGIVQQRLFSDEKCRLYFDRATKLLNEANLGVATFDWKVEKDTFIIFLTSVTESPTRVQSKILRVLPRGEYKELPLLRRNPSRTQVTPAIVYTASSMRGFEPSWMNTFALSASLFIMIVLAFLIYMHRLRYDIK